MWTAQTRSSNSVSPLQFGTNELTTHSTSTPTTLQGLKESERGPITAIYWEVFSAFGLKLQHPLTAGAKGGLLPVSSPATSSALPCLRDPDDSFFPRRLPTKLSYTKNDYCSNVLILGVSNLNLT